MNCCRFQRRPVTVDGLRLVWSVWSTKPRLKRGAFKRLGIDVAPMMVVAGTDMERLDVVEDIGARSVQPVNLTVSLVRLSCHCRLFQEARCV